MVLFRRRLPTPCRRHGAEADCQERTYEIEGSERSRHPSVKGEPAEPEEVGLRCTHSSTSRAAGLRDRARTGLPKRVAASVPAWHQPSDPRSTDADLWPPDHTLSVPSPSPLPATTGREENKAREARRLEGVGRERIVCFRAIAPRKRSISGHGFNDKVRPMTAEAKSPIFMCAFEKRQNVID